MVRLRSDLHGHLQRLPVRFFTQTRTGEILSRVSTDVNAIQNAVTGTFTDLLQAELTYVIAFPLMLMPQCEQSERKSVYEGQTGAVRFGLGGRRSFKSTTK